MNNKLNLFYSLVICICKWFNLVKLIGRKYIALLFLQFIIIYLILDNIKINKDKVDHNYTSTWLDIIYLSNLKNYIIEYYVHTKVFF